MGLVRTKISLGNPKRSDLAPIEVDALVGTGALHLCIPAHIAIQLQLEKREVTVADGSKHLVSYVGPLVAAFGKRSCFTGAMVLGGDVLLGAIPMEDMDLVVRPTTRDVAPNPLNPNILASIAMGARPFHRISDKAEHF
jgi:clan AA aspartic protease